MAPGISKNINIGLPEKPKSSNSSLFTAALLLIISGLFTFFIILPKRSALGLKTSQLAQLTSQENSISAQAATLNTLVGDLQNNAPEVKELDVAMPLDGQTFNLQLLLESMASQSGVSVDSINISPDTGVVAGNTALLADPYSATRSLKQITGEADVIGSFTQLLDFLQKIEDSDRVIQVSSLGITGGQNNTLSMRLDFQTYYFGP